MGFESIPVTDAHSDADTPQVSYQSLIRVVLPALDSKEGKRYKSYRSYSTNICKQNH